MNGNETLPPSTPSVSPGSSQSGASGQAIVALVLGILSLVCGGFLMGLPAFFLGRAEEKAIARGDSSKAGQQMAKIGWILGLVGTILSCLAAIAWIIFIVIAVMSERTGGVSP